MSSYFITGSSSGLGLSMATQLASLPPTDVSYIFATARKKSTGLSDLLNQHPGRVIFISLDVTDDISCVKAANEVLQVVGDKGLDVLINNAAINPREGTDRMDDLELTLNSNVIGTRNVTRALIPLLQTGRDKKVINISSALGSLTLSPVFNFAPGASYKISKAALNMLTRQYALNYSSDDMIFMAISPGYIKTKMGDVTGADLLPQTSADAVLRATWKAGKKDNGRFIDIEVEGFEMNGRRKYTGSDLPW